MLEGIDLQTDLEKTEIYSRIRAKCRDLEILPQSKGTVITDGM